MYNERYLYHATDAKNIKGILEKGLLPNPFGYVFLAETEQDALDFMRFRYEVEEFAIFKLDTRKMTRRKIQPSYDHSPIYFPENAWLYDKPISVKAIESHSTFRRMKAEVSEE